MKKKDKEESLRGMILINVTFLSDLDAEGRSARDVRRPGQQFLPRGLWTRPEGGDPASRCAQQSQGPV